MTTFDEWFNKQRFADASGQLKEYAREAWHSRDTKVAELERLNKVALGAMKLSDKYQEMSESGASRDALNNAIKELEESKP